MRRPVPKIYDAFGRVPAHVAPSTLVRRWDQGLIAGLFVFAVAWVALLALALALPGPHIGGFNRHATGALATAFYYLTIGISMREEAALYLDAVRHPWHTLAKVGIPLLLAIVASAWVTIRALTPRSNVTHNSGPQMLEGKEALAEAKRRSLTKAEREADPHHLALHPALVLPKKHWSRHGLIYGSVGQGKTQILLFILLQLIRRDSKVFIYDVKGDMTSLSKRPIIVSPFDRRSYVWDIGRDCRTPMQAAAFAASIIPESADGNSKFWSVAAQQLLTGVLRYLQTTKGTDWGWKELADGLAQGAEKMLELMKAHHPKAAPLIENTEGQTTASILANLAGQTRVIDELAMAWPKRGKRMFSITDWIRDDYTGRKQVVVQAGGDAQLTKAYIAAMINVAVPSIVSPALSEDESGRCLAFILDELPSLGRINLGPLIDKGRSKGVMVIAGLQDLAQLRDVYGDNQAQAMSSMVGTHIVCAVNAGNTREEIARLLGKRKVSWTSHGPNATAHEESRNVVFPTELTDSLGFRRGKKYGPNGFGIRAIVQTSGDPLLLDFPGVVPPQRRAAQEAARWTVEPPKAVPSLKQLPGALEDELDVAAQSIPMDQLVAEMEAIYGYGGPNAPLTESDPA